MHLHPNKRELHILCYRTSPTTLTESFWIFMDWFCIKYLATFSNQDYISCILLSKSMHLKDLFNELSMSCLEHFFFLCCHSHFPSKSVLPGWSAFWKREVYHTFFFLKKVCVPTVSYLATTL